MPQQIYKTDYAGEMLGTKGLVPCTIPVECTRPGDTVMVVTKRIVGWIGPERECTGVTVVRPAMVIYIACPLSAAFPTGEHRVVVPTTVGIGGGPIKISKLVYYT